MLLKVLARSIANAPKQYIESLLLQNINHRPPIPADEMQRSYVPHSLDHATTPPTQPNHLQNHQRTHHPQNDSARIHRPIQRRNTLQSPSTPFTRKEYRSSATHSTSSLKTMKMQDISYCSHQWSILLKTSIIMQVIEMALRQDIGPDPSIASNPEQSFYRNSYDSSLFIKYRIDKCIHVAIRTDER